MSKVAIYSVRVRFLFSIVANVLRGGANYLANLLIARFLMPHSYGQLAFLLTSFTAIKQLFDQGITSAFFTFISRKYPRIGDYLFYVIWLIVQIVLVAALVYFGSDSIVSTVWRNNPRYLILIAFFAIFMQQILWWSVVQLGEAKRRTLVAQSASAACALVYVISIIILHCLGLLSVYSVLITTIGIYAVGSLVFLMVFWPSAVKRKKISNDNCHPQYKETILEYFAYCKPLIIMGVVTFFYTFLDNWMLNFFSGNSQQAFYQVGYQFSSICLLASTAVLRIFWKEVAYSNSLNDHARVKALFLKVYHLVLLFGAIVSMFLVVWAKYIVVFMLGARYLMGVSAISLMFFYPIHQGVGQVLGASFSALSKTRAYARVSILVMLISIPIAYFLLASKTMVIPGLHLGALGLALRMVVVNILSVNILLFVFCRMYQWNIPWISQIICIVFTFIFAELVKQVCFSLWPISVASSFNLVGHIVLCGITYLCLLAVVVYWKPQWFLSVTRSNLKSWFRLSG